MTDLPPDSTPEPTSDYSLEVPPGQVPPKRRYTAQILIGVGILLIAAIVIAIILAAHSLTSAVHAIPGVSASDGPKNMASGGALLTGSDGNIVTMRTSAVRVGHSVPTDETKLSGTANIVEYIDLQCPYCLNFEATNLSNVAQLVSEGKATLEIHPISILDRSSAGTRYSSRAANAVDCVADYVPDEFLNSVAVLYEYQPAEGSTGLTNKQILGYLKEANVDTAAVTKCVNTEQFRSWVTASTNEVVNGSFAGVATQPTSFGGTPTVFVNGARYAGSITDPNEFSAFIAAQ